MGIGSPCVHGWTSHRCTPSELTGRAGEAEGGSPDPDSPAPLVDKVDPMHREPRRGMQAVGCLVPQAAAAHLALPATPAQPGCRGSDRIATAGPGEPPGKSQPARTPPSNHGIFNRPGVHCVRGHRGAAPDRGCGPAAPTLPPTPTVGPRTSAHTQGADCRCGGNTQARSPITVRGALP